MTQTDTAEIIFKNAAGKTISKKIKIPKKRYNLGITKQREGYVAIGYFTEPLYTKKLGYSGLHAPYTEIHVTLPRGAGLARLKIGKRIVSKAA